VDPVGGQARTDPAKTRLDGPCQQSETCRPCKRGMFSRRSTASSRRSNASAGSSTRCDARSIPARSLPPIPTRGSDAWRRNASLRRRRRRLRRILLRAPRRRSLRRRGRERSARSAAFPPRTPGGAPSRRRSVSRGTRGRRMRATTRSRTRAATSSCATGARDHRGVESVASGGLALAPIRTSARTGDAGYEDQDRG
jgi:hypothetical protein